MAIEVEVTEKGHYHEGEECSVGDVIEVSEQTAESLSDRLNPVSDQTEEGSEPEGDDENDPVLPDNFPGRDPLFNADIKTTDEVEEFVNDGGDLTGIDGIGEATEAKILEALQ